MENVVDVSSVRNDQDRESAAMPVDDLVPYQLTVNDFLRMIDLETFSDSSQVELIDGILVERMTKRRPHGYSVGMIDDLLRGLIPNSWHLEIECPVVLDEKSRPEPDIDIVRGSRGDYRENDPRASDVGLVIEVSDSTYRRDPYTMARLYAEAGIPCYWIVNLAARQVEVCTRPEGQGKLADYTACRIFQEDEPVPLMIEGIEHGSILPRVILP